MVKIKYRNDKAMALIYTQMIDDAVVVLIRYSSVEYEYETFDTIESLIKLSPFPPVFESEDEAMDFLSREVSIDVDCEGKLKIKVWGILYDEYPVIYKSEGVFRKVTAVVRGYEETTLRKFMEEDYVPARYYMTDEEREFVLDKVKGGIH